MNEIDDSQYPPLHVVEWTGDSCIMLGTNTKHGGGLKRMDGQKVRVSIDRIRPVDPERFETFAQSGQWLFQLS
jgi:hypothetical protein